MSCLTGLRNMKGRIGLLDGHIESVSAPAGPVSGAVPLRR